MGSSSERRQNFFRFLSDEEGEAEVEGEGARGEGGCALIGVGEGGCAWVGIVV